MEIGENWTTSISCIYVIDFVLYISHQGHAGWDGRINNSLSGPLIFFVAAFWTLRDTRKEALHGHVQANQFEKVITRKIQLDVLDPSNYVIEDCNSGRKNGLRGREKTWRTLFVPGQV